MPATRRTSIELYPDGRRLVEVAVSFRRNTSGGARVHVFATNLPTADNPAALTAALQQLRTEQKLARRAIARWRRSSRKWSLRRPSRSSIRSSPRSSRPWTARIGIESDPERGTTFIIELPLAARDTTPPAADTTDAAERPWVAPVQRLVSS